MPDIGPFHPQIVHFVIALLFVGVALRIISVFDALPFTKPAASVLIILGTVATLLAVKSGTDAHGPAERIPGARSIVEEHEEAGERTRNVLLAVGALELLALAFWKKPWTRWVLAGSGAIGIFGLFSLYETAQYGGRVVYEYAGGVGTRHDNPDDVERLLVAGLFYQAQQDREAGRTDDAARLIDELARRRPNDVGVQLLQVQSLIQDRGEAEAALATLANIRVANDDRRNQLQSGLLAASAWEALSQPDSARVVLQRLQQEFPTSQTVQQRLAQLGS